MVGWESGYFFWLIWLARDCCIVVYLIVLCMISDQLFIWIFHRCLQRKAIHAWPYHNYISLYQYQISHLSIRFGFYWYHFTIIVHWFLNLECQILFSIYHFWLVVWNMNFMFPYIGNVVIPTDEVIFFRGVGQPPTRYSGWSRKGTTLSIQWLIPWKSIRFIVGDITNIICLIVDTCTT